MQIDENFHRLSIVEQATRVIKTEAQELLKIATTLDHQFESAVNDILDSSGRLMVIGMGKSGLIGKKIVASMASTGTPAYFIHPGEAFHGDLGMILPDDVVVMLSNSGETGEVLQMLPSLKKRGNVIVSITGNASSTLAKNSKHHILCKVDKEACPLQLAPTASTTAALAVGDALTVTLMSLRGFKPENFAEHHPGGSLGRKLLTRVEDLMITEGLPLVRSDTGIKDVIHVISKSGLGLAVEVNLNNKVVGVITDGDIRRAMDKHQERFFDLYAVDISSKSPVIISADSSLALVDDLLDEYSISSLLVLGDNTNLLGVISSKQINI